jgi:hypothetical protein
MAYGREQVEAQRIDTRAQSFEASVLADICMGITGDHGELGIYLRGSVADQAARGLLEQGILDPNDYDLVLLGETQEFRRNVLETWIQKVREESLIPSILGRDELSAKIVEIEYRDSSTRPNTCHCNIVLKVNEAEINLSIEIPPETSIFEYSNKTHSYIYCLQGEILKPFCKPQPLTLEQFSGMNTMDQVSNLFILFKRASRFSEEITTPQIREMITLLENALNEEDLSADITQHVDKFHVPTEDNNILAWRKRFWDLCEKYQLLERLYPKKLGNLSPNEYRWAKTTFIITGSIEEVIKSCTGYNWN